MNGEEREKTEKGRKRVKGGTKEIVSAVFRYLLLILLSALIGYSLYSFNAEKIMRNRMPMPFGYGLATVMSGSMEPTLQVGDLVIIKEKKAGETYENGTVAVYNDGEVPVIHRVTGRTDEGQYIFQGDANNTADPPVEERYVIGSLVKSIPKAGRLLYGLKNPVSMIAMLVVAVLLIVLPEPRKEEETEEILKEIRELKRELEQKDL